jgi:hypothetical protein
MKRNEPTTHCECCDDKILLSQEFVHNKRSYCLDCGWIITLDLHGAIKWRKEKPTEPGVGYIKLQTGEIKMVDWSGDVFWYVVDGHHFSMKFDNPNVVGWVQNDDIPVVI